MKLLHRHVAPTKWVLWNSSPWMISHSPWGWTLLSTIQWVTWLRCASWKDWLRSSLLVSFYTLYIFVLLLLSLLFIRPRFQWIIQDAILPPKYNTIRNNEYHRLRHNFFYGRGKNWSSKFEIWGSRLRLKTFANMSDCVSRLIWKQLVRIGN